MEPEKSYECPVAGSSDEKLTCTIDGVNENAPLDSGCLARIVEGEPLCMSCESIGTFKKSFSHSFNRNPIKALFNIDTKSVEEIKKVWTQLDNICKIKQVIEQKIVLAPLNMELYNTARATVVSRYVQAPGKNKSTFQVYMTLFDHVVNAYSDLRQFIASRPDVPRARFEEFASRTMRDIFTAQNFVPIVQVHRAEMLPHSVIVLMDLWANAPELNFRRAVEFLKARPSVCIEGLITLVSDILLGQPGQSEVVSDITICPPQSGYGDELTAQEQPNKRPRRYTRRPRNIRHRFS